MRAGGSFYRFWYEKLRLQQAFSLPCEVIATISYTHRVPMSGEDRVGSTPPSKAGPSITQASVRGQVHAACR